MPTHLDLTVPFATWVNVHQTYNMGAGVNIIVQNKSYVPILLFVGSTNPPDDSGMLIAGNDYEMINITPENTEFLFAKSVGTVAGKLGVQR